MNIIKQIKSEILRVRAERPIGCHDNSAVVPSLESDPRVIKATASP